MLLVHRLSPRGLSIEKPDDKLYVLLNPYCFYVINNATRSLGLHYIDNCTTLR